MKFIKIIKTVFVIFFCLQIASTIFIALSSQPAQAEENPVPLNFTPQITIPLDGLNQNSIPVGKYRPDTGVMSSDLLAKYVKGFYTYGLSIAGILAAVVLRAGGILWLTSAGNDSRISQAKELIIGSVTGMIILFCSWILLNTINPDLIKLQPIDMKVVKKIEYCCHATQGNVVMEEGGKCPESSKKCEGEEQCYNGGNHTGKANSFSCIDIKKYFCCEYWEYNNDDKKYCTSVNIGQSCPTPQTNYSYHTSYNQYCEQRYTIQSSCLSNCVDKDRGTACGPGFCYNDICWYGKGKEGEPCGDRKDATCFPGTITDPCPEYYGHNFAKAGTIWYLIPTLYNRGRDCGSGLYCCTPTPRDE